MASPTLAGMFAVGIDVLATVVSSTTKLITAQLGDVFRNLAETDEAEWWQHVGFASRPSLPKPGEAACQALALRQGGRDVLFGSRDKRGADLAGSLKDGETCVYAAGADGKSQGRILLKADGSVSVFTRKGNDPKGVGMCISVEPKTDSITIVNSAGHGLKIDSDGVKIFANGAAAVVLGADGSVVVNGSSHVVVDGTAILLGAGATPASLALSGPPPGKPSVKVLVE